jgi:hypothetical protein
MGLFSWTTSTEPEDLIKNAIANLNLYLKTYEKEGEILDYLLGMAITDIKRAEKAEQCG